MAMKPSPRSGHVLTREEQQRGGAKGKRGPSVKKMWEKIFAGKIPEAVLKEFRERVIYTKDGTPIKAPLNTFSKNALEAFALMGFSRAMIDSDAMYKLIQQALDGAPKQEIDVADKTDYAANDEAVKKFIDKHGLLKRA